MFFHIVPNSRPPSQFGGIFSLFDTQSIYHAKEAQFVLVYVFQGRYSAIQLFLIFFFLRVGYFIT